MKTPRTSLLITLTGRDRPGVTSRLFGVLARHPLSVLDVEQVVIRGRLVLGVLLGCDTAPDLTGIHAAVSALAADLGLEAEITTGSGSSESASRGSVLHVTLLGSPLAPGAVSGIAGQIAASGANIDRIGRLAQQPVTGGVERPALDARGCGSDEAFGAAEHLVCGAARECQEEDALRSNAMRE